MKTTKRVWTKISKFLDREVSVTLLFWLVVFLITVIVKILVWHRLK
jgi:hypothetical protein